jgi:hypothetical protein
MKAMKIVVAAVAAVVLLLVVAVVVVFRQIDRIARTGIERGGTSVLGVSTTVDEADVGVFSGTFDMSGLTIANPEGYPSPHFMTVADADVAVTLSSLLEDTVMLPELRVGMIDVNLDRTGGVANYQRILDHIGKSESGGGAEEGKKFVIDTLVIDGATVHVTGIPGLTLAAGDVAVTVPQIRLEDVGTKEPLTTREIVSLVVKTVLSATIEASGGVLPAEILGDLRGRLEQLVGLDDLGITAIGDVGANADTVRDRARGAIDDAVEGAGDRIEDATGDLGDRIRDALPGKKKDDGGG